jgi:hypothetical protein
MKPSACPFAFLCAAFTAALFLASLPACGNGVGNPCGGSSGETCAGDQYCDFGNNLCGRDGTVGRCELRPEVGDCDPLYFESICGCNGRVHADACEAESDGADLDQSGSCQLDPDEFACGYKQCRLSQYCVRKPVEVGDPRYIFTCQSLPSSCSSSPSCACFPAGCDCTGDAATGLTRTCPAG